MAIIHNTRTLKLKHLNAPLPVFAFILGKTYSTNNTHKILHGGYVGWGRGITPILYHIIKYNIWLIICIGDHRIYLNFKVNQVSKSSQIKLLKTLKKKRNMMEKQNQPLRWRHHSVSRNRVISNTSVKMSALRKICWSDSYLVGHKWFTAGLFLGQTLQEKIDIQKVFRPLHFFTLNGLFVPINLPSITNNDKVETCF